MYGHREGGWLTHTQRRILQLLEIQPPWPEQDDHALTSCGKWS